MGKDIENHGLSEVVEIDGDCSSNPLREVWEELSFGVDYEHPDMFTSLNIEQRAGFDEI